ncbi:MAG: hypothetical protein L3J22_09435 [Xanthomonadales bacterium]|nr:hypothetical protein [Xanthomonadales bacterium]
MKITFQKTTILLMSIAIVLLLICSVYYYMHVSARGGYVHVVLEAAENMLKIDKDLSQQSSEDLKERVDMTLDWYLWKVHRLSQHPKLIDEEKNHFERVERMALEAGYDLSGEELTGHREEAYYKVHETL